MLAIEPAGPSHASSLGRFFEAIAPDEAHFHPHPLTADHAKVICERETSDAYYVLTSGEDVVAYGMLRGWDEGFEVPSLGIAVHPARRGSGLARVLMAFLHAEATERGATRVRLTVERANTAAAALYESLGYRFEPHGPDQLVGFIDLRG